MFDLRLHSMDLSRWKDEFPEIDEIVDLIYYNSFALFAVKRVDGLDSKSLIEISRDVESFVAGYLQNDEDLLLELFDEVDVRWDMYVVIMVSGDIDIEDRIKVENDRFFCKKIIIPFDPTLKIVEHLKKIPIFFHWGSTLKREGNYFTKEEFLKQLYEKTPGTSEDGNRDLQSLLHQFDFRQMDEEQIETAVRKHFGFGR